MLNLIVAAATIGVIAASRRQAPLRAARGGALRAGLPVDAKRLWRTLLIATFGTAVASFVYEIAWIRMLALVMGATHSFELMLSAFILGLALGAWWIRSRADRLTDAVRTLGLVQWIMGGLGAGHPPDLHPSFGWVADPDHHLHPTDAGYRASP